MIDGMMMKIKKNKPSKHKDVIKNVMKPAPKVDLIEEVVEFIDDEPKPEQKKILSYEELNEEWERLEKIRLKIEAINYQLENSESLNKNKLTSELKAIQTPYRKELEAYYVEKKRNTEEKKRLINERNLREKMITERCKKEEQEKRAERDRLLLEQMELKAQEEAEGLKSKEAKKQAKKERRAKRLLERGQG